jgi:hypothetical protein
LLLSSSFALIAPSSHHSNFITFLLVFLISEYSRYSLPMFDDRKGGGGFRAYKDDSKTALASFTVYFLYATLRFTEKSSKAGDE